MISEEEQMINLLKTKLQRGAADYINKKIYIVHNYLEAKDIATVKANI